MQKLKYFKGVKMKSLFKAVALITFFSILTRIAGFFFRIYLSRTIGAEALGIYQVSFSIFMVLLTLVASGLPLIISRNTAKYISIGNKKGEKGMMTSSLIFALVTSLLVCALAFAFKGVLSKIFTDERCINILIILLPALVFSAIYSVFRGWMWGKNNYFCVCITELFEQIARILICVIMLSGTFTVMDGATVAGVSMSIACLLSCIVALVLFFAIGGKLGKATKPWQDTIKPSVPITLVRLATSLIQPVIAIIIPLRLVAAGWTNAQAISIYGIAVGMTLPFLFVPSAIVGSLSMALIPDLSTANAKNDTNYIQNRITTSLVFSLFVSALFVPLYIGCGELVGTFFYDNIQSGALLASSAWLMIPIGLTNVTSSILNALGYEVKSLKNYILGAVLLLVSIWFLPKYVGINALVWGMGICMSIASLLNIRMIKKITNAKLNFFKPFVVICLIILPVCAIVSFVSSILANFFTLFFALAISCTLGAVCFVLLCLVFKVIDLDWFVKLVPKKSGATKITGFNIFKKIRLPKILFFKQKRKTKQLY